MGQIHTVGPNKALIVSGKLWYFYVLVSSLLLGIILFEV